jgi:hypothetical protein
MKNTWLIKKNFQTNYFFKQLVEFNYFTQYFFYFFKNHLLFKFHNTNVLLFSNFFLYFDQLNFFIKNFYLENNTHFLNKKKINKYTKVSLIDYFKKHTDSLIISKNYAKIIFIKKKFSLQSNLLNLFFLFNYSMFNSTFKINHQFNFFHITDKKNHLIIFNVSKFLSR